MPETRRTQNRTDDKPQQSLDGGPTTFSDLMAALLLEEPSADDILETLAILQAAVRAHDKDKASEVISVVLVQIMRVLHSEARNLRENGAAG